MTDFDHWNWTTCPFCGSKSEEQQHHCYSPSHSIPSTYKCPKCGAEFDDHNGWRSAEQQKVDSLALLRSGENATKGASEMAGSLCEYPGCSKPKAEIGAAMFICFCGDHHVEFMTATHMEVNTGFHPIGHPQGLDDPIYEQYRQRYREFAKNWLAGLPKEKDTITEWIATHPKGAEFPPFCEHCGKVLEEKCVEKDGIRYCTGRPKGVTCPCPACYTNTGSRIVRVEHYYCDKCYREMCAEMHDALATFLVYDPDTGQKVK